MPEELELKPGCELSRDAKDALIRLQELLADPDSPNDDILAAASDLVCELAEEE